MSYTTLVRQIRYNRRVALLFALYRLILKSVWRIAICDCWWAAFDLCKSRYVAAASDTLLPPSIPLLPTTDEMENLESWRKLNLYRIIRTRLHEKPCGVVRRQCVSRERRETRTETCFYMYITIHEWKMWGIEYSSWNYAEFVLHLSTNNRQYHGWNTKRSIMLLTLSGQSDFSNKNVVHSGFLYLRYD